MSSHEVDTKFDKRASNVEKLARTATMLRVNFINNEIDTSKYVFASEEIAKYMSSQGLKYIAKLLSPLAAYNVFVVNHVYIQGSEDDYGKIISMLKKWGDNYRITSFAELLLDNEKLLERLGVPLSQLVHLLTSEGKVRFIEDSEKKMEVSGNLQVQVANASARVEKVEKQYTEKEVQANLETVRMALTMVFKSVKKPTILVVDSEELELIGASTVLKATAANKNLVMLIYGTNGNEMKKLVDSGRATEFVSGFPYPVAKSELINMCMSMSGAFSPKFLDLDARRGTREGISATIKLLAETDSLSNVAGYLVDRFENPYVAFNAMSTFLARLYARFARNPTSVLEAYQNYKANMKKGFSFYLKDVVDKTLYEALKETSQKFGFHLPQLAKQEK